MSENIVVVYSGRDLDRTKEDGGVGYFVMNPDRVMDCDYILVVRNRNNREEDWATEDEEYQHNQIYMVGKISKVKSFYDFKPVRRLIEISEYSIIPPNNNLDVRNKLEHSQREPFVYDNTDHIKEVFGLDIENLTNWQPFIPSKKENNLEPKKPLSFSETIKKYKKLLADSLGVEESEVHIRIGD